MTVGLLDGAGFGGTKLGAVEGAGLVVKNCHNSV